MTDTCGICGLELNGSNQLCLPTYEGKICWKSDVFTTVCSFCCFKLLADASQPPAEVDAWCGAATCPNNPGNYGTDKLCKCKRTA